MVLRRFGSVITLTASVVLASVLAMPAAILAQDDGEDASPPPATPTAMIRFLSGHWFGPSDLYVDDELVHTGLEFAQITDYIDVPAGERRIEAVGPVSAETTSKLKPKGSYTVALNPVQEGIELKVVSDKAKPKPGQAQARVVAMCWACGPMSFTAKGVKKPLAKYLHYDEGKLAGKYMKVKPGLLDLVPRTQGDKKPVADFEPVTVAPGTSNTLFLVGQDASNVALVPVVDAALSSVRFMNASREPDVVDVYLDGKKVVKSLYPGRAADKPTHVLAGEHLLQVVDRGMDPAEGVLREATLDFPAGTAAAEVIAGQSLEVATAPSGPSPRTKGALIRFAHIDPEIPAVDIELQGLDPVVGLEPGQWTDYIAIPEHLDFVRIHPSSDPMDTYHEFPIDFSPGDHVTAYLGGSPVIPTVEVVMTVDPVAKAKKR